MRDPGLAGDQPRPPARALARRADPRARARPACARGERCGRLERSSAHAPDAALARRWPPTSAASTDARCPARDREAGCRLPLRPSHHQHQTNQLAATSRSEPRVSVRPSGPSCLVWSWQDPQPQERPGRLPQPLTTSLGTSTSSRYSSALILCLPLRCAPPRCRYQQPPDGTAHARRLRLLAAPPPARESRLSRPSYRPHWDRKAVKPVAPGTSNPGRGEARCGSRRTPVRLLWAIAIARARRLQRSSVS